MLNINKCYELTIALEKSLGGESKNTILPKELIEIKNMLEDELRMQAAKTAGGSSMAKRFKAITKYLNNASKNREMFGNGWYIEDHTENKLCFTNGFTGFILNDKFDISISENPVFDLPKCFPQNADTEVMVDLADVKMFIKTHKAKEAGKKAHEKTTPIYKLGNAWYNPNYIIECYDILGGNVIFKESGSPLTAAILESENGKAVLLPVRPPKDEQKTA